MVHFRNLQRLGPILPQVIELMDTDDLSRAKNDHLAQGHVMILHGQVIQSCLKGDGGGPKTNDNRYFTPLPDGNPVNDPQDCSPGDQPVLTRREGRYKAWRISGN